MLTFVNRESAGIVEPFATNGATESCLAGMNALVHPKAGRGAVRISALPTSVRLFAGVPALMHTQPTGAGKGVAALVALVFFSVVHVFLHNVPPNTVACLHLATAMVTFESVDDMVFALVQPRKTRTPAACRARIHERAEFVIGRDELQHRL